MKTIRFIDLFAGIAGFRLGLERVNRYGLEKVGEHLQEQGTSGNDLRSKRIKSKPNSSQTRGESSNAYHCVWSNEWNKYASQIYKKHYGEINTQDIRTVKPSQIPKHDLICAGFPCQSFSIAGKRKGFDDTRGTLFFEIARIAKYHQPMFLLLENVKGLLSHDGGKTMEVILETLQELGYYTNYEVYNSKDYGVPQNRERIFFLCTHIKGLDGQNQKIVSSRKIITEWLFQILLNNSNEAKKLQGHASKDWILGYLICQEIKQNQNLKGENILDGIFPPMGVKYISVRGLGSVAEHRYLVTRKLGRKLKRTEHVHHINCDKKDNRIENLHLFPNVSSHLAGHRSIEEIVKPLMERGIIKFNSNTGRYEV